LNDVFRERAIIDIEGESMGAGFFWVGCRIEVDLGISEALVAVKTDIYFAGAKGE
jgi:hypothetical protein